MKVSNTKSLKPGQMHGRYIDFAYDCDKGWAKYLVATTAPDDRHLFNFDLELVLTGEKRKKPLKAHLLVLDNYGDEIMPDEIRKEVLSTTMFKETLGILRESGEIVRVGFMEEKVPFPEVVRISHRPHPPCSVPAQPEVSSQFSQNQDQSFQDNRLLPVQLPATSLG